MLPFPDALLYDAMNLGGAGAARVSEAVTVSSPTLIDYEIPIGAAGMQRGGNLTEKQVSKALADFAALPLDR